MTLQASEEHALRHAETAFAYDVFVIHAAADEAFAQGYLLTKLELSPARVLRVQTLELGQIITEEIERGVRSSRVTLVVLSSACMEDRWVVFGQQLAAYVSVAQRNHGVLLPLLLEDCKLTAYVESLVKLDFRDPSPEVWEGQIDRLRAHIDCRIAPVPDLPCPYPGMQPFTERDTGRFFGRDPEIDRIIYWLRRGEREIYIIGASGSGKSSLIAAGLVPVLTRGVEGLPRFHVRSFRPGEQPRERLAAALERDLVAPGTASNGRVRSEAAAGSLLLVIDQFEELFAIAGDDQRRGFLAELRALRSDPAVVLLLALRADFYGSFLDSSLLTGREDQISRVELGPLRNDSLRVIIERPARELKVYFQPELVSRLLDDAAREPGALPLLQETLFQLWGKRRQRLLALADYRALSDGVRTGLAFAVKQHADEVYQKLTSAQQLIAFRILLRLVSFGEGRADTRRQLPRDALRSEGELVADFDVVLQRLVTNRLLTVTGDDRHRDVRVDLAHEILIHAWTRFADWIQAWRTHERHRRELEAAAAAWRARGSGDGGLLDPEELAGARAWQDKAAPQLGHTVDLTAFLAASETAHGRAIRLRRVSRLVALVSSVLAVTASLYAYLAVEQRNQRNRMLADSAQLYQNVGWQRLVEAERPLQALPYLIEAGHDIEISGGTLSQSLRTLFAAATRNLPVAQSVRQDGRVLSAGFRFDGVQVVITLLDGRARIWSAAWNATKGDSRLLSSQQAFVLSAALSPDGTRVVTISSNDVVHVVRVWDTVTGEPHSLPWQHPGHVRSAAFSPDGTRVVTVGWDNTVRVWDARTGILLSQALDYSHALSSNAAGPGGTQVIATGKHDPLAGDPDGVVCAAVSPDGRRVVTASKDKTARIWDVASGTELSPPLQHQGTVWSATFSPDGTRIATASEDGTARIWDAATGQPHSLPLQHQGAVWGAAFSPDGTRIVTASEDETARIWDAANGNPLSPPLEQQDAVRSAAFSADDAHIITVSGANTTQTWDAATVQPLSPLLQHQGAVWSAAFSPDGTRVVTASEDHTVRVWDATTGEPRSPPLRHSGTVVTAMFSPDGSRIFTVSVDNATRTTNAGIDKPFSPAFPHEDIVASTMLGLDDNHATPARIHIWNVAAEALRSSPLQAQDEVLSASFSTDGTRVVTASGNSARVWDTGTGEPLSPAMEQPAADPDPAAYQHPLASVAFSADGTHIVTASADKTALIWEAKTGKPLSPPLRHQGIVRSAAFSSDGTRVVTASDDKTARIWEAATGKPLSPPLEHAGIVRSAAFSSDGRLVVTASEDNTARVWDAATGKPLSPPLKHQGIVRSAAFSSDGTHVVTASDDKTARVWTLPLASGTLEEWRATVERADPYVLVNGVLFPRVAPLDQGARPHH